MLTFFPRDVLDEIWDLIESVPTYSSIRMYALKIGNKSIHFTIYILDDFILIENWMD